VPWLVLNCLNRSELEECVVVEGEGVGRYCPHCARVQPAKLVQALAAAVEKLGLINYEQTEVVEVAPDEAGERSLADHPDLPGAFQRGKQGARLSWPPTNPPMVVCTEIPNSPDCPRWTALRRSNHVT
jgi:hypothetical protein